MNVFGSNHNEIGSLSENLILNTAGKIKIRFGNKFVDLLDNQGKIAVTIPRILTRVNSTSEINADGFYLVEGNIYASVNGEIIQITGVTAEFISYALEQELDQEKISLAQKNIGLSFESLEEAKKVITKGIVHIGQDIYFIGDSSDLKLTLNGFLNTLNNQYFPEPDNKQCLAYIDNKWTFYTFVGQEDIRDIQTALDNLQNLDPQSVINAALDSDSYVISKGEFSSNKIINLETYPVIPAGEVVILSLIGTKYEVTEDSGSYTLTESSSQPIYKNIQIINGEYQGITMTYRNGTLNGVEIQFYDLGGGEGWVFDTNIINRKLYKYTTPQPSSPINYTGEQDAGLPAVGSEISDPEKLLIPDIRWVMDYCQQLEAKISELEQNISNNSNP